MCRNKLPSAWLFLSLVAGSVARAAEHGEKAGPPSPFSGDLATAVVELIIFIVLLVVLGKYAWPALLDVLKRREELIRGEIEAAQRERQQTEQIRQEFEQRLASAESEGEKLIKLSAAEAEKLKADIVQKAQTQAQETLQKVCAQVELAKQQALKDIYRQSADIAAGLAEKILQREVNAEDHRVLIHQALDELETHVQR